MRIGHIGADQHSEKTIIKAGLPADMSQLLRSSSPAANWPVLIRSQNLAMSTKPATPSGCVRRPEYPHGGRLAPDGAHRHEQPIEIGHPQRCPGTGDRGDASKLPKLVAASLNDVDGAGSATDIQAPPLRLRIEENIIRI